MIKINGNLLGLVTDRGVSELSGNCPLLRYALYNEMDEGRRRDRHEDLEEHPYFQS